MRAGDTCIDIGANLGYYARTISRLAGPAGRVYAVEPVAPIRKVLSRNLRRCGNTEILPFALRAAAGPVRMGNDSARENGYFGTGRNFVNEGGGRSDVEFTAEMRRGSELFARLPRLDFIKCDIEGYEAVVMEEMRPLLERFRPTVLIETGGENRPRIVRLFHPAGLCGLHARPRPRDSPEPRKHEGHHLPARRGTPRGPVTTNTTDMHQYDRLQRILTGKPFHYTVMFFIVASIAAVIGSSFETMRPYRHLLFGINYLASFVFLVEYVLRIVAAPARYPGRSPFRARVRYLFSFYGAVDFVAVLPFLLVYLFKDTPLGPHHHAGIHLHRLQAHPPLALVPVHRGGPFGRTRGTRHGLYRLRHHGLLLGDPHVLHRTQRPARSVRQYRRRPVVVHRGIHHGRLRRHLPDHPAGETSEQPHQSDRNRHDRHPDRYHQLVVHQPAATEKQERVTPKTSDNDANRHHILRSRPARLAAERIHPQAGAGEGLVEIVVHNLHDYAHDRRKTTDDYPFGGEAGMVMKCEPVFELVEKLQGERTYDEIIYTSPDGVRYDQHEANRLSTLGNIVILCGHYKGIDHRIREHLITREISIGDYVLTGGELAACIIADSVVRLIPGAIGDEASALTDSFQDNLLAPPVYTRPAEFRGWRVPDVLLSGDFARIARWQDEQAWERTERLRPDLLDDGNRNEVPKTPER